MIIEIQSKSEAWLKVKHALRSAGLKWNLQKHLFEENRVTLFLEQVPEPEGGELVAGMIVYEGGARMVPFCAPHEIEQVRQEEIARL